MDELDTGDRPAAEPTGVPRISQPTVSCPECLDAIDLAGLGQGHDAHSAEPANLRRRNLNYLSNQ